jgi:hypothetical protein
MTTDQQQVHHIEMTLAIINSRIARLESDKARLERRRAELLRQHPEFEKGWDVT